MAVGGWYDTQNTYEAYGGDFAVDWPVNKDAIKAEFDYSHFEGGTGKVFLDAKGAPLLPNQNDLYADAGYYFDVVKVQPFLVYQHLNFSNAVDKPKNQQRLGGGINWYISGQNFKISALYERIIPKVQPPTAKIKDTNHFAIQVQALYF